MIVPIETAVSLLLRNDVVAIPTETVYGLAARIDSNEAIAKVFETKGRPNDNPLIVHIYDVMQAQELSYMNSLAYDLASRYWPGPCTIVLPHRNVSSGVTAGLDTVALRMPAHNDCIAILRGVDVPLAAPSANRSGTPSPTSAQHVINDYQGMIPVVDGGDCIVGLESTVVYVHNKEIEVLRPGAIHRHQLLADGFTIREHHTAHAMRSPGTRYRHYSPRAVVHLFTDVASLLAHAKGSASVVVLTDREGQQEVEKSGQFSGHIRVLSPQTMYAEYRRADLLQLAEILVLCSEALLRDEALMNRLKTSASDG